MFKNFLQMFTFNTTLGFMDDDNKSNSIQKEVVKQTVDTIEKALPDLVDSTVEKKFALLSEKHISEVSEIKTELKKYSLAQKQSNDTIRKSFTEAAMTSIIKRVWNENVNTEQAFKSVVESEMKTMSEGEDGLGGELVFDQFEKDILRVINDYTLINSVKVLQINKGDKINLPKGSNSISTIYVGEKGTPDPSDAGTGYVTIDIYKAVSLVNMTDELLDDTMTVPDLYKFIVDFIAESQAEFLENEILNGSGTDAIEGILNNTDIKEVVLAVGEKVDDIDDDVITKVLTSSPMKFKRKSSRVKWVGSQYIYGKLRSIKTADGYPLYPELRNMANPMLEGYKFEISDVFPVQNSIEDVANKPLLLFGDLTYFTLIRRKNLSLERGHYGNNWRDGIQTLKGTARFGGKCTFGEAFTVLKSGPAA